MRRNTLAVRTIPAQDKESGLFPNGPETDFWGNYIWGERCGYCAARAAIEKARG